MDGTSFPPSLTRVSSFELHLVGACSIAGRQMDQVVSRVTRVFHTGAQAPSITVRDKPVRKSVS